MRVGIPIAARVLLIPVFSVLWGGAAVADEQVEQVDVEQVDEQAEATASSRIKPGALHLDYAAAYLEFESGYQDRRVKYSSKPRTGKRSLLQKNHELEFREKLGLNLAGDVFDPNLIDWRADLALGLTQTDYRESVFGRKHGDYDNGFLGDYDVSLDILKAKPLSMNVYARRTDDRISRQFLPALDEETTETGFTALALTGPVTTEFGFSFRDVDRTGNRLDEDDEQLRQVKFWLDSRWEISDHHRLRFSYDHTHDEYTYQGSTYDFDTQRDDFRLEHELDFGESKQHRLDTFFHFSTEKGDLARDELQLVPRLTVKHSDKLKTIYRYGFYRFDQDDIRVNQHKFDAQALYQPDKHWRISLDGFGLCERADDDVETCELGGGLDVGYTRPTSLGEFNANVAFAYDRSRTSGDAGMRVVRGETHVLGGVSPVFLTNRHPVAGSIVVHNGTRTRIYVPGIDYYIVPLGHRIQLGRIPTGRIANGDVVYVDYRYEVPVGSTVDTYRSDLLVEHRFDMGLTPYYSLESRCQHVDAAQDMFLARDNTNRHRLGLKYDRERWSVGTEYEVFDDTVEPYDAYHLTGRVSLIRTVPHNLDATMELSRYYFEGGECGLPGKNVWWLDVDVTDRMQLNRYLSATAGTAYRWEDDSVDGTTHGVDARVGLEYRRGELTVELTAEYDLLSLADSREDGLGVWLRIRRDLSNLFGSSRRGG
ncbi:MAG: hypothetical protein JXQ75_19910 [Phycisphaerae bacterium]|nr:hypothetical protein [Phycisphaerae bacterium]